MLFILARWLPEEKFKQACQLISNFEKKGNEEVERKIEAFNAKIHT
jgi:hypothetical protein